MAVRDIFEKMKGERDDYRQVECKPLRERRCVEDGKSLVSLVRTDNRRKGIEEALRLLGGMERVTGLEAGARVLIKPNMNSDDPFPASTHPETIRTVITLLKGMGVRDIRLGDSSGPFWLPTRKTMEKLGIIKLAEAEGVPVHCFDEEEWVKTYPRDAAHWRDGLIMARTIHSEDNVISLPALKTHQYGGIFTLSMKNAVGIVHPKNRGDMHNTPSRMPAMIAEMNLVYSPCLIILDGMECFVTGGPMSGGKGKPRCVIAGDDRVAVDAVGVAVLKSMGAPTILREKTWEHGQIKRGAEIGLGARSADEVKLLTSDLIDDKDSGVFFEDVKEHLRN